MTVALEQICPSCYETQGNHAPDCPWLDEKYQDTLEVVRAEFRGFIRLLMAEIARLRAIEGSTDREVGPDATVHELKTHPAPFMALAAGVKTFEFRKNDRNFAAGDVLLLKEWDPKDGYTGSHLSVLVLYVVYGGGEFGVPDGYCVMSVVPTAAERRRT